MSARLAWISIAPVKGLGLVSVDRAQLDLTGVPENRRFYLLDHRGKLVNGKTDGPMVQVRPEWDGSVLALNLPGGTRIEEEVRLGDAEDGRFFGLPRPGRAVLGPFSDALSELAGRPLVLVQTDGPGIGVDRGPDAAMSMVSVGAVGAFDQRRFRMLFGIDGVPAHAEDGWLGRDVRIGSAVVRPLGVTGRCLVTSQDPETGVQDMDMLGHIRETRPDLGGEPLPFGVHGAVIVGGPVAVGDPVSLAS